MIGRAFFLIKNTISDIASVARSPVKGLKAFYGVSLYRNSLYLILNNVSVQATGFFFWTAAARLYRPEAVGLASAAIAAMQFLAQLATLGFDYSLIRFLPESGNKARDMINTALTLGGLVSGGLAIVFVAGLDLWSPALVPIRQNTLFLMVFIVSAVLTTLNLFSQRIFVARRRADLALTRGLIFGLTRFVPLIVIGIVVIHQRSIGIFVSWGIAIGLAVAVSLFSITRIELGYRPFPSLKRAAFSSARHYSATNYISNILVTMPGLLLPVIVINRLGAEPNAYFYVGWNLCSILLMIPQSLSLSLLAEGSHDRDNLRREVVRSAKLMLLMLVPAVLVFTVLGDRLLLLFGSTYSETGTDLVRFLAPAALPYGLTYIYFSIQRVRMRMGPVTVLSLIMAVITLGLSWVLLPVMGIAGAGIAWLAGQVVVMLIIVWQVFQH